MMNGRDAGKLVPWYGDSIVESVLKKTLSPEELVRFTRLEIGKVAWLRQNIERKFLDSARDIISGHESARDAVHQARAIEDAVAAAAVVATTAAPSASA